MEWFRVWHDLFDDPKLRRLSKSQKFDLVTLIRLASGNSPRGRIDLDDEDIAEHLDLDTGVFAAFVALLTKKEIVERAPDGRLVFLNWSKRQPKTDNVAERVAAHRAKRTVGNGVTLQEDGCNVTETYDVTVEQNRTEQNKAEQTARPAISHSLDDPLVDRPLYLLQLKQHTATDEEISFVETEMRRRKSPPRQWTAAYMWPIILDFREKMRSAPPAVEIGLSAGPVTEHPNVTKARALTEKRRG